MKRVFLFVLFSLIAFYTNAQFSITGKITNEKGEALAGANVFISNSYIGTTCDLNGNFELKRLSKGSIILNITFLGYETAKQTIDLNENKVINITLKHSDFIADDVIVSSTRANDKSPVAFTVVDKKDFEKQNVGQDVPYLLNLTPSLVTSSDAGTGVGYTYLRIRGTDASRINVTVNGIPFNDAESHSVYWVDIPDLSSSVENIQIQRGVGTSTNGAAAFGASINLQTTTLNKEKYTEISSSIGSFNTKKIALAIGTGLIKDHFTFDARLSKINSEGYIDRAFSDLRSYFLSTAYYFKKNLIRFNIFNGFEETYQAWLGVPSSLLETNRTYNPYTYKNEIDHYDQTHYQLLYSSELCSKLNLNFALHYTKGNGYYEQYKSEQKFSKYGLENAFIDNNEYKKTNFIRRKWLDNDFYGYTFSINYKYSIIDAVIGSGWNKYLGNHFGRIVWSQYNNEKLVDYEWYRGKGDKTDFNIYGKVNISLLKNLNLFADIQLRKIKYEISGINDNRIDITQNHNYNFFNPKFGLFYDLSLSNKLYISYAISHREPTRTNFTDADEGKAPTFETLYNYEAGYKFQSQDFSLNLNFYYMNYTNQLALTGEINSTGDPIMVNVPSSYRQGIEMIFGYNVSNILNITGNLTLSKNKIKNFTEYVDDWDTWEQRSNNLGETDLSFSPNIVAGSQISVMPFKNLTLSLISKYVGKQYIDNTSSEDRILKAYFINDCRINYVITPKFMREISFQLLVNNIFSKKYETNAWIYRYYENNIHKIDDGYFPQALANFMLGVTFKF